VFRIDKCLACSGYFDFRFPTLRLYGVGLTLTVDTIRLVHPLLLVQINTRKNIVNFPPMLPKFVNKESGWRGKIWRIWVKCCYLTNQEP
jgi:hypothetical protein